MEEKNMIPENWEEQLELCLEADQLWRLFPKAPDHPTFPYSKGRITGYLVEFVKYLDKIKPRLAKLTEIDKEEAQKIQTLYISMAWQVIALATEWVELLDKTDYVADMNLKEVHHIYADFIKNSVELKHLYMIARERLRNCAILRALECEASGTAEECKEEDMHVCFLNNVG